MKTNEPRAIRLNQGHRDDTVDAVIAEYKRQNPCPTFPEGKQTLHELAAKYLPKLTEFKVAKEILDVVPDHVVKDFMEITPVITVLPINSEGEVRGGLAQHIRITQSLAEELGLPVVKVDNHGINKHLDEDDYLSDYGATVGQLRKAGDLVEQENEDGELCHRAVRVAYFLEKRGQNLTVMPPSDEEYYTVRRDHNRAVEAWSKEVRQLKEETADMLRQFSSTKQLREGWPDIVPYLPPHIQDPEATIRVPVPVVSRLNERLGISSQEPA